jgi:hypothetical protein
VVRSRAEQWFVQNGYRQLSGGSTIMAEKRAPSDRAGVTELVVMTVALDARGVSVTYAQRRRLRPVGRHGPSAPQPARVEAVCATRSKILSKVQDDPTGPRYAFAV